MGEWASGRASERVSEGYLSEISPSGGGIHWGAQLVSQSVSQSVGWIFGACYMRISGSGPHPRSPPLPSSLPPFLPSFVPCVICS